MEIRAQLAKYAKHKRIIYFLSEANDKERSSFSSRSGRSESLFRIRINSCLPGHIRGSVKSQGSFKAFRDIADWPPQDVPGEGVDGADGEDGGLEHYGKVERNRGRTTALVALWKS